jgi:hypothetical protein
MSPRQQEALLTLLEIAEDTRCRVHRVRRCTICIDDTDTPVVTEADIDWTPEGGAIMNEIRAGVDAKLRDAVRNRHALLCDAGANAGLYALDLKGRIYLTAEECDELGVGRS